MFNFLLGPIIFGRVDAAFTGHLSVVGAPSDKKKLLIILAYYVLLLELDFLTFLMMWTTRKPHVLHPSHIPIHGLGTSCANGT
jgi:hypothetical protein